MEKLKPYPKYKPVNLPWLKEIPAHWDLSRNKVFLNEQKKLVGNNSNKYTLLSLTKDGIVNRDIENAKGKFPKDFYSYKIVDAGDIIFCLFDIDETPRTVGLSRLNGMITGAYDVFKIRNIDPHFFYYYYLSIDEMKLLKPYYRSLRKVIKPKSFLSICLPVPPFDEQKKIVAFLDEKTAKIDKYIEAKSKEIELLKEQKNAEISNAVTRGLNPNTKFKPVNLPWLKEIPAHWGLRFLFQIASEHFISNKYIKEQNLLSLSYGKIIKKDINITEGLLPVSFDTYQVVGKGNVIIRPTDLQNDHRSLRVGLARERGIITSAYIAIEPSHELCPEYLYYLLHTYDLHKEFYRMGGGMRQSLKWRELRKLNFYIPSLDEQKKIIAFLDDKTEKYTKAISAIQRKIDLLKEYKTRLISDAVTGKIRV